MNAIKLGICVILPAAWKTPEAFVEEFVTDLFGECENISELGKTYVFFAVETSGREDWEVFNKLSARFPNFVTVLNATGADLYLTSFKTALGYGVDMVLELDCSNAHDAADVPIFLRDSLKSLSTNKHQMLAVLSTRFALGGKDHFPGDRVLLSKFGTVFARVLLMLGRKGRRLSDLTSGFEAFSADLLKRMFELSPPEKWVSSWWGPLHLFQTEARALVCWIAASEEVIMQEKPISFGAKFHRKLAPLNFGYLLKAFTGGLLLIIKCWSVKLKLL